MADAAHDVVVLGGGPAGAATALALRRHAPTLSVAMVEASFYEDARIGETLPPQARPLLEQLDIWAAFQADGHEENPGTVAVWGDDKPYANDFLYRPYGEGWHLDRARFDRLLAQQAKARGCALYLGSTFAGGEPAPPAGSREGWRLELRRGRRRFGVEARFVVDATGRRAVFARRRGAAGAVFDRLLGVYAFFRLRRGELFPARHTLVEAWEDGWWYAARLPGARAVVACMTDADRVAELGLRQRQRWLGKLGRTRYTREILEAGEAEGGPRCYPAHSQLLEPAAGPGWLAVGDSASTFDPLSSLGIFKALRFGVYAAYAAADHLRGDEAALRKYRKLVAVDFDAYLETRREYYRREQRWPHSPFWRRRFGELTLDPGQVLQAAPEAARRGHRGPPMHLPARDLQRLISLCGHPRAAHEVAADLRRQCSVRLSDRRIVLALQELVADGVLVSLPARPGVAAGKAAAGGTL